MSYVSPKQPTDLASIFIQPAVPSKGEERTSKQIAAILEQRLSSMDLIESHIAKSLRQSITRKKNKLAEVDKKLKNKADPLWYSLSIERNNKLKPALDAEEKRLAELPKEIRECQTDIEKLNKELAEAEAREARKKTKSITPPNAPKSAGRVFAPLLFRAVKPDPSRIRRETVWVKKPVGGMKTFSESQASQSSQRRDAGVSSQIGSSHASSPAKKRKAEPTDEAEVARKRQRSESEASSKTGVRKVDIETAGEQSEVSPPAKRSGFSLKLKASSSLHSEADGDQTPAKKRKADFSDVAHNNKRQRGDAPVSSEDAAAQHEAVRPKKATKISAAKRQEKELSLHHTALSQEASVSMSAAAASPSSAATDNQKLGRKRKADSSAQDKASKRQKDSSAAAPDNTSLGTNGPSNRKKVSISADQRGRKSSRLRSRVDAAMPTKKGLKRAPEAPSKTTRDFSSDEESPEREIGDAPAASMSDAAGNLSVLLVCSPKESEQWDGSIRPSDDLSSLSNPDKGKASRVAVSSASLEKGRYGRAVKGIARPVKPRSQSGAKTGSPEGSDGDGSNASLTGGANAGDRLGRGGTKRKKAPAVNRFFMR